MLSIAKLFRRDLEGAALVEAALVMPLLIYVIAGIAEWGLTMYEYHRLSLATGSAVRQLIINRGFPNPYTNVTGQFSGWSENMKVQNDQITVSIQKPDLTFATCNTDAACTTLLDNAQGLAAKISVTYPCQLAFTPPAASPCPLNISMTGLVD